MDFFILFSVFISEKDKFIVNNYYQNCKEMNTL